MGRGRESFADGRFRDVFSMVERYPRLSDGLVGDRVGMVVYEEQPMADATKMENPQ